MINKTFTGTIGAEIKGAMWTCVVWPESKAVLGTGKAKKVKATVDGYPVQTALLPTGTGAHMLPISKPVLKAINKKLGDTVTITIDDLV
jgi:hypothetical protein